MKKTYQILNVAVEANSMKSIFEQLRSDYLYISGLFFESKSEALSDLSVGLKVNNVEILPVGSDVEIFAFNGNYSRNEALWNFEDSKIEADGKTLEAVFENKSDQDIELKIYCLLKNA